MDYIIFETAENSYKLRLNTRYLVLLEKTLNENPLPALIKYLSKEEIPPMETMMNVFYYSLLAYQPDIKKDKVYDIFDEWLASGHIIAEFLPVIIDIYRHCGLIQKEKTEKN